MAQESSSLVGVYRKFKPHLLMVLAQMGYTFLYFITEASFNHGMNPHVYITYRHIVSGVVTLPFAYFLERYRCVQLQLFCWISYMFSQFDTIKTLKYVFTCN